MAAKNAAAKAIDGTGAIIFQIPKKIQIGIGCGYVIHTY